MERIITYVKYLTKSDILQLHKAIAKEEPCFFVKPNNIQNPGSLDWVLEAIQSIICGIDLYPTLIEKAAILSRTIICDHVFYDGNKRTGLLVLLEFMNLNDHPIKVSDEELLELGLRIVQNRITFLCLIEWIKSHIDS